MGCLVVPLFESNNYTSVAVMSKQNEQNMCNYISVMIIQRNMKKKEKTLCDDLALWYKGFCNLGAYL